MKALLTGICLITVGIFGCNSQRATGGESGVSNLSSQLGAGEALSCDGGSMKLGVVNDAARGKSVLVTLNPKAGLYTLTSYYGELAAGMSWKDESASLALGADLKGNFVVGAQTTAVTCKKVSGDEAASWAAAKGVADYQDDIQGLAETVSQEMADIETNQGKQGANATAPTYQVYAVETSRLGSLDLGTKVNGSEGTLPGEDGETDLDDADYSYGGIGAAYGLGGGEDYGEWFQGASDGIGLGGSVSAALGQAHADFASREKVGALDAVVTSKSSAVEITVGAWTFFVPDTFAK